MCKSSRSREGIGNLKWLVFGASETTYNKLRAVVLTPKWWCFLSDNTKLKLRKNMPCCIQYF